MPRDSGDAGRWLASARSDLALVTAGRRSADVLQETLCYHCQQAVEKSLKALLIAHGVSFPRTHNVGTLLDLLPGVVVPAAISQEQLRGLTAYAVLARYPGDLEDVSASELDIAFDVATRVLAWTEAELVAGGGSAE